MKMTPYQVRIVLAPESHIGNTLTISESSCDGATVAAQQDRYSRFVSGVERRLIEAFRNG